MAENSEPQRKNSQKRRGPGKPFQRGKSGNPGGRPKGFAALVRERTDEGLPLVEFALRVQRGEELVVADDATLTVKEQVEIARLRLDAGKWLADRGWGNATQPVEHSGEGGGPLTVELVRYDGKGGGA